MPIWVEVLLVWGVLGLFLNLLAFHKGYFRFIKAMATNAEYNRGYEDAVQNLRKFYRAVGEIPDDTWVKASLDYRLKVEDRQLESSKH